MKALLAVAFRWSWLLTLPVTAVFAYWLWSFGDLYAAFQLRYDVSPHRFGWVYEGGRHFQRIWRRIGLAVTPPPAPSGLRTVQLILPEASDQALRADLPHSGFEYAEGHLLAGGRLQPVEVRYRGDFLVHWAYPKKSLRIKTRKGELFDGMRRFNLIAPKFPSQANNYLGYRLAERLGLLAPRAELVEVTINGRRRGTYLLAEQIEESTLRARGRMPGDVYSGELVAKDAWRGVSNLLFDHPGLWRKVAVNNHFPPEFRQPLERLCRLAGALPDEEVHRRLGELLDLRAFAALSALEILTQYFHTGESHNWRLYYDPWRTRFEPILWDPNAWGDFQLLGPQPPVSLDPNVTRLHELLLSHAGFLRARHAVLRQFFASGAAEAFLAEVRQTLDRARRAAAADPYLEPPDPARVAAAMEALPGHIESIFAAVRREYLERPGRLRYRQVDAGRLLLEVSGRTPLRSLRLRANTPLPWQLEAELGWSRTGERVAVDVTGDLAVEDRVAVLELPILAQLRPAPGIDERARKVFSHRVLPSTYELVLHGLPDGFVWSSVEAEWAGGARTPAVPAAEVSDEPLDHLFRIVKPSPKAPPRLWSGKVRLQGATVLEEDLFLAPGTTVVLAPGASLVLRGRMSARGTAAEPIRFLPADPARPWGTVALVGAGASGSFLRHCEFDGGSGWTDPAGTFEYSGMFSLHDAGQVRLEACAFRNGRVTDDTVHAVYTRVEMRDCSFDNAAADALDLDLCRAVLTGCRFRGSGNDAIDLMGTECLLLDSTFARHGDKGVSVGEGSRLVAANLSFADCAIGVQVKDGSVAMLRNADFTGNGLAIDAYRKNWRYGQGGTAIAWRCRLRDNRRAAQADRLSRITLQQCVEEDGIRPAPRVLRLDRGAEPALPELADPRLGDAARRAWRAALPRAGADLAGR